MKTSIFFRRFKLLYVLCVGFLFVTGCKEDDSPRNFSDDTNLRLKSVRLYNDTNPTQIFTTVFNYSNDGRLLNTQANSLGSTANLTYDSNGRLTQIGDYMFFYNNDNQVIRIENVNLSVAFGTYENTTIEYFDGNIASISERFLGSTQRRINEMNVSYNNQRQLNLFTRTIKDVQLDTNQEFIQQMDKESFSYTSNGNLRQIIQEFDFDSGNTPVIEMDYSFDSYKNPSQLVLKTMGIEGNSSMLFLRALSERSYFNAGPIFNYFTNNIVGLIQIPQTSDPGFRDLRFRVEFDYNEYGYPIKATETQTSLTGNFEIITNYTWEYELY